MSAPLILAVLSGILFGSWSVALKKARGSNFENFFLTLTLSVLLIVSTITFALGGTGILGDVSGASLKSIVWGIGGGACWGLATLSFGYALTLVGLALGYAIILGVGMFFGTSISMFFMAGLPSNSDPVVKLYVMVGMVIALVGIVLTSYAGHARSKASADRAKRDFKRGIPICILSGFLGSFFALGYAGAHEQLNTWASTLLLMIGFSSVLVPILVARIVKLRNWRAYNNFKQNVGYPLLGSLAFAAAVVFYSVSAGEVRVALAYPLMMGIQILSGNLWSFLAFKEWRGAPRNARALQILALTVLVLASILIGRAMGFVS